jgi:predicted ATP-binding protein involved in virulence
MKMKTVKWTNHPILGNLVLDLINPSTNLPYETIIFAGENGAGKTTILESISKFLNIGSFEFFEEIEYIIDEKIFKAVQPSNQSTIKDFFDIIDDQGTRIPIHSNRNNNKQSIETNLLDIRHYGCVFSKARADYKTNQISYATTKQLDIDKYDIDNEDDFTSLKQLIVDVHNQDNSEYAETNKHLGSFPKTWDEFYPTSKTFRFKNAFDTFFVNLTFDKVIDENNEKVIQFKKNNRSISIDNLSTGEKQIVFRGIYLLRNNQQLKSSAIMIDEPELSLHPKWQQNILKYYKNLFTDSGIQTAQLFIATHSEYVIKDALQQQEKTLVIILKDNLGVIENHNIIAPSTLPSITSAETNFLAFNVVSNDYHIELYGYLQQKENKLTVKSCDEFIKNHLEYNPTLHSKPSSFSTTNYETLSTYIRNAIDHPEPSKIYSNDELKTSIELLIKLCI